MTSLAFEVTFGMHDSVHNQYINTAAELSRMRSCDDVYLPLYVIHRAEQAVIYNIQHGDAASVHTAIAKMILNKMAWAHHPHDEA